MRKSIIFMMTVLVLASCTSVKPGIRGMRSNMDSVVRCDVFDTSMREGVSCYRIPSLVTAHNGDLIAAIDERVPSCGDLKWNKDINIVIRRSKDNGRTWAPIQTVADFPFGQSASDPSMIVDGKTGEIFLFYNYMDLDKERDVYHFHVVSSRDNGKTWSKPRDITSMVTMPEMKHDFKFITSGRGVYTSDGKMLHTIVNIQKGLYMFGSDDHGKTWHSINKPVKPADESKIIDLPGGEWMINSRVNKAGLRYVHVSKDNGMSWKSRPDSVLVDPGCNASIIKYTSVAEGDDRNRIIISHAADEKDRRNLTVRVSYDNGRTWAYSKTIYPGPSAYSSLSILKNGDIAVFYEKDDYRSNEVAVFSLDWLTDGADTFRK